MQVIASNQPKSHTLISAVLGIGIGLLDCVAGWVAAALESRTASASAALSDFFVAGVLLLLLIVGFVPLGLSVKRVVSLEPTPFFVGMLLALGVGYAVGLFLGWPWDRYIGGLYSVGVPVLAGLIPTTATESG